MATTLTVILFCGLFSRTAFSQPSDAEQIRKLEDLERRAILHGDTTQLAQLMSRKIVVQNPENTIVGFPQIMARIRSGKISYAAFERKIENIALLNGMAVVMGVETITPQGNTQNAGSPVKRRFTNIWTKENRVWKLTARQATIVSGN